MGGKTKEQSRQTLRLGVLIRKMEIITPVSQHRDTQHTVWHSVDAELPLAPFSYHFVEGLRQRLICFLTLDSPNQ